MPDYIPQADPAFHVMFIAFKDWCAANGAAKGLSAGEVTALTGAFDDWNDAYTAHQAAQTAAGTARLAKDAAREAAETLMRAAARKLQASPTVTDMDRNAAHLTVAAGRTAAPVPTTRPLVMVDAGQRLQHTIHFKDETTPGTRKKPQGVQGVEVWCAKGPNPPTSPGQCLLLAMDTNSPYVVTYDGEDAGQIAHYMLRWVNTRGEFGPWSETVSATIGA